MQKSPEASSSGMPDAPSSAVVMKIGDLQNSNIFNAKPNIFTTKLIMFTTKFIIFTAKIIILRETEARGQC